MKKIINKWIKDYFSKNPELNGSYNRWIKSSEGQITTPEPLSYRPLISVVVPVYNVPTEYLEACINSVLRQTYDNWELCMADDCSTQRNVRRTLKKFENNKKIKIVYRNENGHISRCTNTALDEATGEFIAFLDCDDILAPYALYEVAKILNQNSNLDFIYSDEDKLTEDGKVYHLPFFKPDWSPDTFMSLMYTNHLGVYRTSIAKKIGRLRPEMDGSQDYDFTLRFMEQTNNTRVRHIDKILYHWRERKESVAADPVAKPYALEAARRAKEDALHRRNCKGYTEYVNDAYQYRVVYEAPQDAFVSIIIPSKDNADLLFQCINSILNNTDEEKFEIIIVDNGSEKINRSKIETFAADRNIKYLYSPMNFNFSHMCNIGAENAKGNFLLFLNDDTEVTNKDWLERMVGQAALPHVGAVGAKLLYPNSKLIQHVGVINLPDGPCHALAKHNDNQLYYFCRNRLEYDCLAVTGACLMIEKKKFFEMNCFEEGLTVSYNDVELCFKLYEVGYYNVVRNDVVIYHYESVSRGVDAGNPQKTERLNRERELLFKLHPNLKDKDPFYNKNLDLNKSDYSWGLPSEFFARQCQTEKSGLSTKETHKLTITIDNIQRDQESIHIDGWFYWHNSVLTNFAKVYLALRDPNGNDVFYRVERTIRNDVAEALCCSAYNSGFVCKISIKDLELQRKCYQLGLMVETPIGIRRIGWSKYKVIE